MTFCRVLSAVSFAAVLAMASAYSAQAQFGGMPGMPGSPGMGGFGGPPAGPPPACQQLMVMRDERQKNMDALSAPKAECADRRAAAHQRDQNARPDCKAPHGRA